MNVLPLILIGALPTIASDPEPSALPVVVYAEFQHKTPQAVLNAMHQEVSSIMAPVGVQLEWRLLDNMDSHEAWLRLAVVQFKGTCDISDLSVYPPIRSSWGERM